MSTWGPIVMLAKSISNTQLNFSQFWLISLIAIFLGTLALIGTPTIAMAQDEPRSVTLGRALFAGKGNCSQCHGWHGDGAAGHMGNGPSLRITYLDEPGLVETISCGRPGSYMPYHMTTAYRETFPCYGFTDKNQLGDMKVAVGVPMRAREIANVAAFIIAEIKGKELDLGYCERYYGANSRNCDGYR